MDLFSNKLSPASQPGGRPRAAVELAPGGALAAALPGKGLPPVFAYAALPHGALTPGIAELNLHQSAVVTEALRTALDSVSPADRAVTLVIPDTATRVFMLDFDSLPAKLAEALPVLRFRMRKMVPFDVEHAAVTYQVLEQHSPADKASGQLKVLATLMPFAILAEYEAAVRAADYEPGAVLPSSLAALAALDSPDPILAANLSGVGLTTAITHGQDLLLYRTVELPADRAERIAEIQRSVAVAAAYFEDKLSAPPRQIHYAGAMDAREFARYIGDAQLSVVEVAPAPVTDATTTLGPIGFAGVMGALAGVA